MLALKLLYKIGAVEAALHSELRRGYRKPACFSVSREVLCKTLGGDAQMSSDLGTFSQIHLKKGAL